LNGIDAETGGYLVPPISLADAAAMLRGPGARGGAPAPAFDAPRRDAAETGWLLRLWRRLNEAQWGLPFDVDPAVVRRAGWAAVFHEMETAAVRAALDPLIAHRRRRVDADRCHVLDYREGETPESWLGRHLVGAGSVEPKKVPYYLLLVGGPERFPFSFCHQLDVEYAVGCIHFDTPGEYEQYARSVIAYETSAAVPTGRDALFFGTQHDPATDLSANALVRPLAEHTLADFRKTVLIGTPAVKAVLADVLAPSGSGGPPAIALTATHGLAFPPTSPLQRPTQGALLCQDWAPFTPPGPDDWFAAADVAKTAHVHGLVAFVFACYGGGTPSHDRFLHRRGQPPPVVADRPFISALPKALLAHPNGGALACIGHVERAWGYSIVTEGAGAQLLPFENALGRLAAGEPVGHAVKDFNERYASLSTRLNRLLEQAGFGAHVDDRELAAAWVECNDAEGYLVIGDPAVALRIADMK
jgi:hypothetical protein